MASGEDTDHAARVDSTYIPQGQKINVPIRHSGFVEGPTIEEMYQIIAAHVDSFMKSRDSLPGNYQKTP